MAREHHADAHMLGDSLSLHLPCFINILPPCHEVGGGEQKAKKKVDLYAQVTCALHVPTGRDIVPHTRLCS